MNNVTLIGRLVRDPEMRYTPGNGKAVTNFTLAVDRGLTKDKKAEFEQKGMPTADFIRIVSWGKQAENCAKFLEKGRMVAIQGSIQTSSFKTKEGDTRYSTDIMAHNVEFLEWGDKKTGDSNFGSNHNDSDMGFMSSVEDDDDIPF